MASERSKKQRHLHPSIRSARLIRHVAATKAALRSAHQPLGFITRDALNGNIDTGDNAALLDLLTAALDLADDKRTQTLVAYARTSLIIHITQSTCR